MIKYRADMWNISHMSRRLTDLIYGSTYDPYWDDTTQKYLIGSTNDIWLRQEQGVYILTFRYPNPDRITWIMQAIKNMIQNEGEYLEVI